MKKLILVLVGSLTLGSACVLQTPSQPKGVTAPAFYPVVIPSPCGDEGDEVYIPLDEALKSPEKIEQLNFSGRGLRQFPGEILLRFPNLKKLILCDNRLQKIPTEVNQLLHLEKLDFSNNDLAEFPTDIYLPKLKSLNLGGNRIRTLPSLIKRFSSLQSLNLMNTNLEKISPEVGELKNLEELELGNNKSLFELPNEVCSLQKLKILSLEENNIYRLPKDIGKLTQLEAIYIYGSPLNKGEIERLKKLLPNVVIDPSNC